MNTYDVQTEVDDEPDCEREEEDEERKADAHSDPPFFYVHEELCHAGKEKGERDGGHDQLISAEEPHFLHVIKACDPVIASEEAEKKTDRGLIWKP